MGATRRYWIAEVRFSASVRRKLATKHNLHAEQVEDACLLGRYISAREDLDPDRGLRLIVVGVDRAGNTIQVLLKPIDAVDGIYRCVTARMVR